MTDSDPNPGELLRAMIEAPPERRRALFEEQGGDPALAVALGDEAERLAMAEAARGLEATETVVQLADDIAAPRARVRARRARAQALAYAGRLEEALETCRAAMALAQEVNEPIEGARVRMASLHPLGELGRYDEAVAAGEAAYQALIDAGQPQLAARADINLGVIHQNRDDPVRALEHFERASAALRADPVLLGYVENNRGEALLLLNDFAAAHRAFEAAREACAAANSRLAEAIAEGNLADLSARQGRLEAALRHFETARRRLEQDAATTHLARLSMEQAEAMATLGLADDALRAYEHVLPQLDELGLRSEAARARRGWGSLLSKLGELDDAETLLEAAESGFEELNQPLDAARVALVRAEIAIGQNRLEEAGYLLEDAADRLTDRALDRALLDFHRARLALAHGRMREAESLLAPAIDAATVMDLAPLLADLLHLRARARLEGDRYAEALDDITAAVTHVERVRGSLQAERFRAGFLSNRMELYQDQVAVRLHAAGDTASIFQAVEQAKGRALSDVLAGALDAVPHRPADDRSERRLIEQVGDLRAELNALYSQRYDLEGSARADRANTVRAAIRERERAIQGLESRLASTRAAVATAAPQVDLAATRAALRSGQALVSYFLARDELIAITISSDDARVHRGLASHADITGRVERLQFQLARGLQPATDPARASRMLDHARRELHGLYEILIAPFADLLCDCDHLTFSPAGPLHLVPFHALYDGSRHLIENAEVSYSPSAALLPLIGRRPPRGSDGQAVVIGFGDRRAPQIEEEARRVATILRTRARIGGEEARTEQVQKLAPHAELLHLACHGHYSARAPLSSGLKLADGWLTVRDVSAMQLNADLVTLSGCSTGRNLVEAGDELIGLLRGFLTAGARAVLATLWTLHDEAATQLMEVFYGNWRRGEDRPDAAAALRTAQRAAMQEHPHPARWAPFILVGKP